jgi:hypothetical protein
VLLRQKASIALPDNEFVDAEIKLPAAGLEKVRSGDAGCSLQWHTIFFKLVLAIAKP